MRREKTGLQCLVATAALVLLALTVFAEDSFNMRVRRDGDRVWIDGVKGWFCGDKESSVHAAQEAAMQAIGEKTSYDELLGVSGLAFRMQVSKVGLCPSSPHPACGYPCVERSTQSLPWTVRSFAVKPDETEKAAEARRCIVESIDRGTPVQYGSEEDGVIVGYRKTGQEWICLNPYHDGGRKTFVETRWPWGISVFAARKSGILPRKELAREALAQAVTMAGTPESGVYFVGFKAWETYIQRLKALETADALTRKNAMQGNAWIYECLAQYRSAAARYLKSVAGEFEAGPAAHLTRAAGLYEKMANQVLRDDTHCVVSIAPYPFTLKDGQQWTLELRQAQVRRLEAALPLEREAISEIRVALGLLKPAGPESAR